MSVEGSVGDVKLRVCPQSPRSLRFYHYYILSLFYHYHYYIIILSLSNSIIIIFYHYSIIIIILSLSNSIIIIPPSNFATSHYARLRKSGSNRTPHLLRPALRLYIWMLMYFMYWLLPKLMITKTFLQEFKMKKCTCSQYQFLNNLKLSKSTISGRNFLWNQYLKFSSLSWKFCVVAFLTRSWH